MQQPEDVFNVPALVVAGEADEFIQTYDAGGALTGTHALEDGFISNLERLVVGPWGYARTTVLASSTRDPTVRSTSA